MGNNCCKKKKVNEASDQLLSQGKQEPKLKRKNKQKEKKARNLLKHLEKLDESEKVTQSNDIQVVEEQKDVEKLDYNLLMKNEVVTYHEAISLPINIPPKTSIRLQRQLTSFKDILPISKTNSIFVSCNQNNLASWKALITGCSDTPYAFGAFVYQIDIPELYPQFSPTVNLLTTGNGTVRFNPNLYSCGQVCLSLLGTWPGNHKENWTPTSNIAQVLLSIQSIVMNENVLFNEPSYETFQQSKSMNSMTYQNQGYQNIVQLNTLKHAINGQLQNPPQQFQNIILKHFNLVKDDIIQTIGKWVQESQKNVSRYDGLVTSHNYNDSMKLMGDPNLYQKELEKELVRFQKLINTKSYDWKKES